MNDLSWLVISDIYSAIQKPRSGNVDKVDIFEQIKPAKYVF